jgi:SAM-dependent methyltransferase
VEQKAVKRLRRARREEINRSVLANPNSVIPQLRRLRYSIASTGLSRVLMEAGSRLLSYRPETDRSFDARYGTDTSGRLEPSSLGIADAELRERAIVYLASPEKVTRWMLDNVEVIPHERSFVDLGCGKGRVLLVAAQRPFRSVIGVELSPELSTIARHNLERFPARFRKCQELRVENADATSFDFPDTDLLIHLYHPFEPDITGRALQRLHASILERPRRVTIAYLLYTGAVGPVREVFAAHPWLRETRYEHSLFGNYDWLFFAD